MISLFRNLIDYIYFQIIYNGEPSDFLKTMSENNFNFDTQNKTWTLKRKI